MHFIFLSFTHIFNLTSRKCFLNMRSFRLSTCSACFSSSFVTIYGEKPRNFKYVDIQICLIFVENERVLVQSNAGTENRPKDRKTS